MDLYVILKLVHVIGACVLFGTGLGIAFFMWMANRTKAGPRPHIPACPGGWLNASP